MISKLFNSREGLYSFNSGHFFSICAFFFFSFPVFFLWHLFFYYLLTLFLFLMHLKIIMIMKILSFNFCILVFVFCFMKLIFYFFRTPGLFENDPTDYEELARIQKVFEPYSHLWQTATEWIQKSRSWLTGKYFPYVTPFCMLIIL